MPRHHNRAILSEITEKGLDPKKEYVAGKNGLTLSASELKKIDKPTVTNSKSDKQNPAPEAKVKVEAKVVSEEVELTQLTSSVEFDVVDNSNDVPQDQGSQEEDLTTQLAEKETKVKKKPKSKLDQS
jgi:hypothetical protein